MGVGLHNKPKAAVHPERKLTGPKKKKMWWVVNVTPRLLYPRERRGTY